MNVVKRAFGIVWLLLAPASLYFIISNAIAAFSAADAKISKAVSETAKAAAEAAKTNTILQWSIIVIIFLPIAFGLVIFGKYALAGEYDSHGALQKEVA